MDKIPLPALGIEEDLTSNTPPPHLDLDEFRFEGDVAVTLGAAQFLRFFGHVSLRLGRRGGLDLSRSDGQLGKNVCLRFLVLLLWHQKKNKQYNTAE